MASALRISPLIAAVLTLGPVVAGRAQAVTPAAEQGKPVAASSVTSSSTPPKHDRVMSRDFAATLASVARGRVGQHMPGYAALGTSITELTFRGATYRPVDQTQRYRDPRHDYRPCHPRNSHPNRCAC